MFKALTVVTVTGSFCALAAYAWGTHVRDVTPVPMAERHARPVSITRPAPKCNDTDWLCLVAWADEQGPKAKHKRRS